MLRHLSLEESVRKGEGQTLEFKKSMSLQNKGLEALCAMVNSDVAHGMVVFGIESNGTICGVESGNLDTVQLSLLQTIKNKFEPALVVQIEIENFNNKMLLVIRAERSQSTSYHEYDGRAWIREGSANRLLTLAEKESLVSKRNRDKHSGPWKCDRCGTWVGMLINFEKTPEGMKKTYKCQCGGEFWPA